MKLKDPNVHYQKWQAVIDEQQASGLTQKAFCKQKNIDLSHFVYYRGKLKKILTPLPAGSFVPVNLSSTEDSIPSSPSSEIKVLLPNGFQCTFEGYLNLAYVK